MAWRPTSGGASLGEPIRVGEMGVTSYFTDGECNLMGLWQSAG